MLQTTTLPVCVVVEVQRLSTCKVMNLTCLSGDLFELFTDYNQSVFSSITILTHINNCNTDSNTDTPSAKIGSFLIR